MAARLADTLLILTVLGVAGVSCGDGPAREDNQQGDAGLAGSADADADDGVEYLYVAVVSETSSDDALFHEAAGPDLDAVMIGLAESGVHASDVTAHVVGFGTINDGADNVLATLGANDVVPTDGGDCDLDLSLFWAMGADGLVVLEFARAFTSGENIRIWEAGPADCPNMLDAPISQNDTYRVFVGDATAAPEAIEDSSDFDELHGWHNLGTSSGVSDFEAP